MLLFAYMNGLKFYLLKATQWREFIVTIIRRAVYLALLGASVSHSAQAQQAKGGAAASDEGDRLDTVVVLGTSRSNATMLTSTAPVDVITPEQLQQTGAVTINQALSKLHPSFNFPQGQNAVKGQGVRAASLRGVGPAYTLVLVNGKRRNVSAQLTGTDPWPAAQVVDINTIPVSAVDHIEVLRDGAAAQYGSDAIAGVINIVLKKQHEGGDATARYGGYTDGGGATHQYVGTAGFRVGDDGFININIDRLKNGQVDRSEADWRQLFPNGDPRNTSYPKKYGQWGQSSRDNWAALVNTEKPLSEAFTAYGWANYSNKSANNYVNPERVVAANTQSPTATNGAQLSPTDVLGVYPNGYQPAMTYKAQDWAAVAGLRYSDATLGDLDVGVSYGKNETGRYTYNSINPSFGTASPTSFYLGSWKTDTISATADYVKELPINLLKSAVLSAGALYRRESWGVGDVGDYVGYSAGPLAGLPLWALYSTPTTINPTIFLPDGVTHPTAAQAAGSFAGIYNQYTQQFPGVAFDRATGSVPATGSSTAGIQPLDAGTITRNVKGAYVGLDASIAKLDVGVTGRYEHYSDFGDTSNYRLTARYEFVPAIAVRGTASSGFHAPSLAQLGQQNTGYTGTFTNNGLSIFAPGFTRQFRPNDPAAAAFGAKPLDPEKSTTLSFGTVFRPDASSSVTIDAYRLTIKKVITVTDALQTVPVAAAFTAAGLVGYTQATYYLNAWDTRTQGIDVVGRKQFKFTGSTLDLTAATSFLNTKVSNFNSQVNVGGSSVTALTNARVRDAETGVPKNKVILNGRYTQGAWAIDATGTRYSKYRYNVGAVAGTVQGNGNVDQEFSPETYFDLGFDYQLLKNLRLGLLVQNVFNKYPDKYVLGNRSSGINPYSFIAPNGASGRFVEGGLTYSF